MVIKQASNLFTVYKSNNSKFVYSVKLGIVVTRWYLVYSFVSLYNIEQLLQVLKVLQVALIEPYHPPAVS